MITPSFALTATERVLPKLALDFTTASLDPRVTFTRALNTATVTNSSGYIVPINADLPRFDYNPITLACNGLLIEESRTNVVYDSAFQTISGSSTSNNVWYDTIAALDTTSNYAVSPDNTQNACLLAVNTNTSSAAIAYKTGITTTGTYAFSVYAKPASTDTAMSIIVSGDVAAANYIRVPFTLSGNGTVGATTLVGTATAPTAASISKAANGYYRCIVVVTLTSPTNIYSGIYPGNRSAQTTASQTLVWGAQLETGAFATSYIPTTTTALTRNADVATMTGTNFSSWFNATQGTFTMSYLSFAKSAYPEIFTVSDGTNANRISTYVDASNGYTTMRNLVANTQYAVASQGTTQGSAVKGSFAYSSVGVAISMNATAATANNNATQPSGLNKLNLGSHVSGSYLNGYISKVSYYPQRLTANELQAFSK